MLDRRVEDRQWTILMGETQIPGKTRSEGAPLPASVRRIDLGPESQRGLPSRSPLHGSNETVFLVDGGDEETVFLVASASVRQIPRGDGGDELLDRAAKGAGAWRRQRSRTLRRIDLPRRLIAFAEDLGSAATREDVLATVGSHAATIVGGYRAIVFAPSADRSRLEPVPMAGGARNSGLWIDPDPSLAQAGTVTEPEATKGTGGPYDGLAPLFTDEAAVRLAYMPLEEDAVVLIVERRTERFFDAEDWELLQAVTRQAATALERVDLFEQVRELSLTDPLTGLANRRQLSVVMERSIAAARRGKPLALVMLDLDDFKRINDEQGHPAGDRALCLVADVLREEARGADLVVRFGGDEFLVVLPGGDRMGALTFLERVHQRLAGRVSLSAGISEYDASLDSVEQLIQTADRDLYARKARRGKPTESAASTSHTF